MQKNAAALTPATLVALAALATPLGSSARAGELVYGVTENQTLISFDSNAPTTILSGVAIWGMAANEQVRGLDFRPATNELYALGSFSMLYKINAMTGMAMQVGSGTFAHTLNGSSFGFDFNPVIDRIRVVSEADQNLVLHPDTAAGQSAAAGQARAVRAGTARGAATGADGSQEGETPGGQEARAMTLANSRMFD
ncbi:MAG: DUF4394 domain-containing protein [Phycisphaerales bacterium]|nr:DUF4394 domain-containing protein [Phycisphaerales bacterium]